MSQTPIYNIEEMEDPPASPDIIINEAIRRLEVMASKVALDFEDAPPTSIADGDVYVVDTGTGAFAGHDDEIVYRSGNAWHFVDAREGELWCIGSAYYRRTSTGWTEVVIADA